METNLGRVKILLVDDNKDFCTLITQYIELSNELEIVDVAYDGREAIELLKKGSYDVVVCDVILPYFDGLAIAKFVSGMEKRPKLMLMSAAITDSVVEAAGQYNVDFFIKKPFALEELVTRIHMIIPRANISFIKSEDVKTKITKMLQDVGIPAHIKGYKYLRVGINMALDNADVLDGITKNLYPMLAREFATSPQSVERTIRHAIEVAWDRGNVQTLEEYFGWTINRNKGKPTNSEFIAMLVDKMQIKMAEPEKMGEV